MKIKRKNKLTNALRLLTAIATLSFCLYPAAAHAQVVIESTGTATGSTGSVYFWAWANPSMTVIQESPTNSAAVTASSPKQDVYSVTPASPWINPIGTSNWVSFEPGTQPGGTAAPDGYYVYMSNAFTVTAGQTYELQVLADDTTAVELDPSGPFLSNPAYPVAVNCASVPLGDAGCTASNEAIYYITAAQFGVTSGSAQHYLGFSVDVGATSGSGPTGLDFVLTALSPEPGSFLLLATGMAGALSLVRRRSRV